MDSGRRIDWEFVIAEARAWVLSLDIQPTLRQVFYFAVSRQFIPNSESAYKTLSRKTARARRDGTFPPLADGTREIWQPTSFAGIDDLSTAAARSFRLDRWATQEVLAVIAVEKRGFVPALQQWFGNRYGLPIVAMGGYGSQTVLDDLARLVREDGRPAVLLYGGDFDASGLDIERDLIERAPVWSLTQRVALTEQQVADHGLPPNPAKSTDSRTRAFAAKHGFVQVELDALDPSDLRREFADALAPFVDESAIDDVIRLEDELRSEFAERNGVSA